MNLYEIASDLAWLQEAMESDEELPEDFAEKLNQAECDFADKVEAYARVMLNLKADAAQLEEEAKRLTERKKRFEKRVEWLKTSLLNAMTQLSVKNVQTSIGTFSVAKNPVSLTVTDESKIPQEFFVPQPPKLDATMLKNYLKETGEVIEGAALTQTEGVRFR